MEILCSLKNLNLSFGPKELFKSADMTLHFGERVGLLGLNGHGKSSLFKILGESLDPDKSEPPFLFSKAKKTISDDGHFSVFLVPQEPPFKKEKIKIHDYVLNFYPTLKKLVFELEDINRKLDENSSDHMDSLLSRQKELWDELDHKNYWDLQQNYESYLRFFELYDHNKTMSELSGGEQKKVLLSLGLSTPCQLVLWDEPTNHLDLESIELLEQELTQSQKTMILTSHDRYFLSKVTQRILHIQHKKLNSFEGNYTDYLEHLSEQEEERKKLVQKLKNGLKRETEWMRQGVKARGTRSKKRVENFHELMSKVKNLQSMGRRELNIELAHTGRQSKALLELKNVSQSFSDTVLFENVNLEVHKKDKIGLLGSNGTGKTTLIQILCEKIHPTQGKIKTADDLVIKHYSQHRSELNEEETPFEFLGRGQDQVILPDGRPQHVMSYFEKFLFNRDDVHRPIRYFSGGERNRLQLAYHMLGPADLWIFDEPTNDLDLETLEVLEKTLSDFKQALILISHDRAFLNNVTNKIWLIHNQEIETFQSGYSHAESFLEAVKMESLLRKTQQEGPVHEQVESEPVTPKKKEHSKGSSAEIEAKITEYEEMIEKLQDQLTQMTNQGLKNSDEMKRYGEMNSLVEKLEEKLLELYEQQTQA